MRVWRLADVVEHVLDGRGIEISTTLGLVSAIVHNQGLSAPRTSVASWVDCRPHLRLFLRIAVRENWPVARCQYEGRILEVCDQIESEEESPVRECVMKHPTQKR